MKSSFFKLTTLLAIFVFPIASSAAPLFLPGTVLQPTCPPGSFVGLQPCTVFPLSIGAGVASGTPGSIPFIDDDGALQQDNANLKWDEVNRRLTLSQGLTIGNVTIADSVSATEEFLFSDSKVSSSIVSGNYLYGIADFNELRIIDISDPTNLILTGSLSGGQGSGLTTLAKSGDYVYTVSSSNNELVIFDVTNPASPTSSALAVGNNPIKVFASGNYLYVVSRDPKVEIFDITSPGSPVLAGSVTLSAIPNFAVLSGSYLYTMGSSLLVVDVSNPAAPAEVGSVGPSTPDTQFHVQGNYVYVFDIQGNTELDVIDVSTPASPAIVVDDLSVGSCPTDMAFYGNYLYVAHCGGVAQYVVDITNPATASVVGQYDDTGYARSVTAFGSYLISTESNNSGDSVKVWSLVATPEAPLLLATLPVTSDYYLKKPLVNGSYAYFTSGSVRDLYSVDLTEVSSIYAPNDVVALSVDGTIQSTILSGGGTIALYSDNNGNIVPSFSDQSLKQNISDISSALSKIRMLQGKYFDWKDAGRFGTQREMGFIAQEVEPYVPEVVRTVGSFKTLNYANLTALLSEGVKELDGRLATLESLSGINEEDTTKSLLGRFADYLKSETNKVIGGIVHFVGKIFAKDAQIDNGVTVKDRQTGSLVCMTVSGGVVVSIPGSCEDSATPSSDAEIIIPTQDQEAGDESPAPETPVPVSPEIPEEPVIEPIEIPEEPVVSQESAPAEVVPDIPTDTETPPLGFLIHNKTFSLFRPFLKLAFR